MALRAVDLRQSEQRDFGRDCVAYMAGGGVGARAMPLEQKYE